MDIPEVILDGAQKVETRWVRPLTNTETTLEVLFVMHLVMIAMVLVGLRSTQHVSKDVQRAVVGVLLLLTSAVMLDGILAYRFPGVMSYVALGTGIAAVSSVVGTLWAIVLHYLTNAP